MICGDGWKGGRFGGYTWDCVFDNLRKVSLWVCDRACLWKESGGRVGVDDDLQE